MTDQAQQTPQQGNVTQADVINDLYLRIQGLEQQLQQTQQTTSTIPFRPAPPPEFHGGQSKMKVEKWLFLLGQYFSLVNLHKTMYMLFAVTLLRGAAASWWRALDDKVRTGLRSKVKDWDDFKDLIRATFHDVNTVTNARNQLDKLEQ